MRKSKLNTSTKIPQKLKSTDLKSVTALTENQQLAFSAWKNNKNLVLDGSAGVGKTFLGFYLGIKEVLDQFTEYKKLLVVRSTVQVRSQGFLPGDVEEKQAIFELPYKEICYKLFGFDAWLKLKIHEQVDFISTSFIRGITLDNCVILVDEMQNMEYNELLSIITRVGENCRIVMCGDYFQSDLKNNKKDILNFLKILSRMKSVETITFTYDDVVRSDFVKEFLKAELEFKINN